MHIDDRLEGDVRALSTITPQPDRSMMVKLGSSNRANLRLKARAASTFTKRSRDSKIRYPQVIICSILYISQQYLATKI